MQKFSYHTHTNSFGIFDGKNSTKEMIKKAQEIGYLQIGVSDHLIFHPKIGLDHPMFFNDAKKALDAYKKLKDQTIQLAEESEIDVLFGFEVDYFANKQSLEFLDKITKELEPDYLIGASHFLINQKTDTPINMYLTKFTDDDEEELNLYWQNLIEAIKSKRFNFIAHIDLLKIFNLCTTSKYQLAKEKLLRAIIDCKQPVELNTSGWNKIGEQHPAAWMLEVLRDGGVPIVVSDDAHSTEMLGQHYQKAESLLESLNYSNRFEL